MYINRRAVEQELKAWKRDSKIGNLRKIQYKIKGDIVHVYASRPGYLIGGGGKLIRGYIAKMKPYGINNIEIHEVEDTLI